MHTATDMRRRTTQSRTPTGTQGQVSLIRLARISADGQDLALQAMRKFRRCWDKPVEAFLVHDPLDVRTPLPAIEHCRHVSIEEFSPTLVRHLVAGRLFTATASEASCELPLYALASGVPLDAISLHRLSPDDGAQDARPRHGEIYLGMPCWQDMH